MGRFDVENGKEGLVVGRVFPVGFSVWAAIAAAGVNIIPQKTDNRSVFFIL